MSAGAQVGEQRRSHRRLQLPAQEQMAGFAVGDTVVYASHGLGHIEATTVDQGKVATITLSFCSGLKVVLPLARALETLRPLATDAELDGVQTTLRAETVVTTEPWSQRYRLTREKVASGRVTQLAEVVRDGLFHERRRAASGGGMAAPSDRQLYLQARLLLSAEIAQCRGIDEADADAWIVDQVGAP